MSIFQGKLQEYPFIAIDNFTAETLDSDAFFLSHCHSDHMVGLSSEEFFERLKASKMVHLYCSETTKNLMKFHANLRHLCQYTRDIPVNQPTVIHIKQDLGEMKSLVITLIPAGHCVGSVMFLFEGDKGAVLYTGDFRLQKGDIRRVPCLKSGGSVKKIQGLYIDTTFCIPTMNKIPKREDTKDAMIKLMGSWLHKGSNYAVYIQCKARYGFEYLLKEIAKAFKMKIHLDDYKYDLYSAAVTDMAEYFTKDKLTTQIHSCVWQASGPFMSYVPCGISNLNGKPVKVMTVKPSTLWFSKKKFLPDDHISYDKGINRVVHSMHSSYEEIRDVVEYIRPKYIYPAVNPVDDDVIGAYDLLKDLLRSKDDDSQDTKEKQENQENQASKVEVISEERVTDDQWQLGLRNETVMSPNRAKSCFSDLGIKNEAGSPPMPSFRRKLKRKKQIENEFDVGLKKNKDCSVDHTEKEKDIIASDEVSSSRCSSINIDDETNISSSTNSNDSNEIKNYEKHVDSLVLHEKHFKRQIFARKNFEGQNCPEQNCKREGLGQVSRLQNSTLQGFEKQSSRKQSFETEGLEQSREKDASQKTSARPLFHGRNSESRTLVRQNNNDQNEAVKNLNQQNICERNSPERQSFGWQTDELQNISRHYVCEENSKLEKPSRQNLGDEKRNLAWRNIDDKTTDSQNIGKENDGKQNFAQQKAVEKNSETINSEWRNLPKQNGIENIVRQNIMDKNSALQTAVRQNLERPLDESQNRELQNIEERNLALQRSARQITKGQNIGERLDELQNPTLLSIKEQNLELQMPGRRVNDYQIAQQQYHRDQSHEGLSYANQILEKKSTKGPSLLEDQDNVTTISSASKNLNKLSNVRGSIKDRSMEEKSDNCNKRLEKPSDSPPDQFDIPVSPGCEGPSEEKLHSLYIKISKEGSIIKN